MVPTIARWKDESGSIVGLPGILFRLCHKIPGGYLLPGTSLTCPGSDGTDKRLHPFVFDVFAEDNDELVDDGPATSETAAPSFLRLLVGTH
jgi:hypothetical protein